MQIKFEQLKKKAKNKFLEKTQIIPYSFPTDLQFLALIHNLNGSPTVYNVFTTMKEWQDYGLSLIDNWDIRCFKGLVRAFPSILPSKFHKASASCDFDDSGWYINFD